MSSEGPLELAALSKHTWPGLTSALSEVFVEAAAVCLHCHRPADEVVELFVECSTRTPAGYKLEMRRPAVTPQMLAAHRDLEEATERGATCIAALLAFRELGYELAERARKKSGIDYWLTRHGEQLFSARLEISGILSNPHGVSQRRSQKKQQATASAATKMPVILAIVEFSTPVAVLEVDP